MDKISVRQCRKYSESEVYASVKDVVDDLGGMERFVRPGQRVLIKPNLLTGLPPDMAVTTHPSVVGALARLAFQAEASEVWIGDSPATQPFHRVAAKTGMSEVAAGTGAKLTPFDSEDDVQISDGRVFKSFPLARRVREADVVISAAKLKTHGLTSFTGAVKNLYGCLPGTAKAQMHLRLPRRDDFGKMLVDLYRAVNPALCIIDGVVGMEGRGPRNGKPREIGVLMGSVNGFALDAAACSVIGLNPLDVPYLRAAETYGDVCVSEAAGQVPRELKITDYDLVRVRGDLGSFMPLPPMIIKFLQNILTAKPSVESGRCTGCGVCRDACPPSVIAVEGGKAAVDYSGCIRCYCCQELCPNDAVRLREGWALRQLNKFRK